MKIGLDCRLAGHRHAGIGRYTAELAKRLPTLNTQTDWVYFFYDQSQAREILDQISPKIRSKIKTVITPIKHYSLSEQLHLAEYFKKEHLDLLHIPHFNAPFNYSGTLAITIHDLLWHEYRGARVTTLSPWQYWAKYLGYRWLMKKVSQKATVIFVPTQTIKDTLTRYYPSVKSKTVITLEGIDSLWHTHPVSAKLPPNIKKFVEDHEYLVYVGSLYPHKNIELVLKALSQLPQTKLVIVGSRSVFHDQIKKRVAELKIQSQVLFAGYLQDQDLIPVIDQATTLVQPSFSEGFGLTGVEALARGCQLLASDIPIFREVYQAHAHYFDPNSPTDFVRAYQALLSKPFTASSLQKYSKKFNWVDMAQQTIDEYLRILAQK
jgi:glycosyltransferase involved in cell wall biosynthesis